MLLAAFQTSRLSAKDVPFVLLAASRRYVPPPPRRHLEVANQPNQLIERLSNHDVLQSRAFSIAMRRINSNAFAEYVPNLNSILSARIKGYAADIPIRRS